MSSYQYIKIFIVNKKNVNQVVIFVVFLTNIICIGSSNHIFSAIIFRYYALLFVEK